MNLLGAIVLSESMAINTKRFTWDLNNYKDNILFILHQFYLLIPNGHIVTITWANYIILGFYIR